MTQNPGMPANYLRTPKVWQSLDGCPPERPNALAAAFLDNPYRQPDFGCSKDPYYSIPFDRAFAFSGKSVDQ